ncbi:MAG: response regulator transcription factor [Pseudomonadota bacterium]
MSLVKKSWMPLYKIIEFAITVGFEPSYLYLMGIRILMADDVKGFRAAIRAVLARDPGLDIVGEAGDGDEAVRMTDILEPDVVLLDINMPGKNGVQAAQEILSRRPDQKIVFVTMYSSRSIEAHLFKLGGKGLVPKDQTFHSLPAALRTVFQGGLFFSSDLDKAAS